MKRQAPRDPLVGVRIGKLQIMERLPDLKKGAKNVRAIVLAQCDCGERIRIPRYYLVRKPNPKQDCGCVTGRGRPARDPLNTIEYKPEYRSWRMMIQRCTNRNHVSFKDYGGRGIKVHEVWLTDFKAFLEHVGPRPSIRHTLDRIRVNGNYEPGNVKWSTPKEQGQNKRTSSGDGNATADETE